jgi:Mn-dependent DtxR family transcriptional regulator
MVKISSRELIYLQAVQEENREGGARLSDIAKRLGISVSSVYEEINHLCKKGLVNKSEQLITITNEGEEELRKAKKAHRVIEELLLTLGFERDRVCQLSSSFDLSVPDEVIERIYVYLGRPSKCPHGREIP